MKIIIAFLFIIAAIHPHACVDNNKTIEQNNFSDTTKINTMNISIGSYVFVATLVDNEISAAFKAMLPLTISMTELNGNEKYCDLPYNLSTKASNPGTIKAGDVMLYGKNTLVLFYKTFTTSYSYTKLGHINDVAGLQTALGSGNVIVTFKKQTGEK